MGAFTKEHRLLQGYSLSFRAVVDFLCCALILCLIGGLAYHWMDGLLKEALIESAARQSKTLAFGMEQQFDQELAKLRTNAELIATGRVTASDMIEMAQTEMEGKSVGILDGTGTAFAGDSVSAPVFQDIRRAESEGIPISYQSGHGLFFVIPMQLAGQSYLLYECYDDNALRQKFKALSFNGEGSLILIYSQKDWTILSEGSELINQEPGMQPAWDTLWEKHQKADPVACYYRFRDKGYFVFASKVSDRYGFYITGYAPWSAVAVGIDYIYGVMIAVFCSLLLLLFVGVRYAMKAREGRQLQREKYVADAANRAKSEFLSNMSHEIRTPINAVMGMGEMILRESREPQTIEYAQNLQTAAKSLLGLINDILDFSKIEAGKMDIIPVEYELGSLLSDLTNMIQDRAEKKGLVFAIEAAPELPSVLFGDEIRLKQVITNILTNGVKYTEKGSVTLRIAPEPAAEGYVILAVSVKDTGIGIKAEDMQKLFSAFERIEEKRNRAIEGTGLGINITNKLLALMDSRLVVESVYGKGSVFSFRLKQKVLNPAPLGDFQEAYRRSLAERRVYREAFTAPKARILVVDDTAMNLTVVRGLLKQTKLNIDTAESGAECLKMAAKCSYDVIFLDHRMPGMDGIETLKRLRKLPGSHNQKVPVISLTANAISGAREEYLAAGFQDYLTKPIDSSRLEELLIKYLPQDLVLPGSGAKAEMSHSSALPSWLASVGGLDIKAGISHCGTEESYLAALSVFAESVLSGAEEIEGCYRAEDWSNYTTKVHALKSSARIIGAGELSERAKRLEDAGNAGYVEEIRDGTGELLRLYRSYAEKLAPLLSAGEGAEDKPLIDDAAIKEAYEAIGEMAASFDYDSVQYVLENLAGYRFPAEESVRYQAIRQAARIPDWEKLTSLLAKDRKGD
ncbi:MAG: response regulator [Selenomonadaceae bacterium]|nr:response regulator [Selenomonadaceae bacterium]